MGDQPRCSTMLVARDASACPVVQAAGHGVGQGEVREHVDPGGVECGALGLGERVGERLLGLGQQARPQLPGAEVGQRDGPVAARGRQRHPLVGELVERA